MKSGLHLQSTSPHTSDDLRAAGRGRERGRRRGCKRGRQGEREEDVHVMCTYIYIHIHTCSQAMLKVAKPLLLTPPTVEQEGPC